MERRFGKKDLILLVIIAVILVVIFCAVSLRPKDKGGTVVVKVEGDVYGTYSLVEDQEIPIESAQGIGNTLVIEDGYANMIWADCPDELCVKQKKINANGQTIVCLPHKVVVEVQSDIAAEFDTIAQ